MSLPRYIILRGETYHVRKPVPLDLHTAFNGRKEVTRSLRTKSLKGAVAASHAVLAEIEREFDRARRAANADQEERAFFASDQADEELRRFSAINRGTLRAGTFAARPTSPEDAEAIGLAISSGTVIPRPTSKAAALRVLADTLDEVEIEAAQVDVVLPMDEEDTASLLGVPARYIEDAKAFVAERIEADRRSLNAQRAMIVGAPDDARGDASATADGASLTALSTRWKAQRRPKPTTQNDMRTSIRRFEAVNGPLGFRDITVDHARRFKDDLVNDARIKGATKARLWGLLRALLTVAVDDQLIPSNPVAQIKVKFEDDAVARETLTKADLATLFSKTDGEDWWMFRLGLYTGARLGEICQLTKSDLTVIDGTLAIHIREDVEAGKSVKTKASIRKVPVHQQLLADGLTKWAEKRPGDRLFEIDRQVASKRLLRRMRSAGLSGGKVFHSLRHTFKGRAREVMDESWHDRITGHVAKTVGQTYGGYDLRTMKAKIDLVTFGIEAVP